MFWVSLSSRLPSSALCLPLQMKPNVTSHYVCLSDHFCHSLVAIKVLLLVCFQQCLLTPPPPLPHTHTKTVKINTNLCLCCCLCLCRFALYLSLTCLVDSWKYCCDRPVQRPGCPLSSDSWKGVSVKLITDWHLKDLKKDPRISLHTRSFSLF